MQSASMAGACPSPLYRLGKAIQWRCYASPYPWKAIVRCPSALPAPGPPSAGLYAKAFHEPVTEGCLSAVALEVSLRCRVSE